MQLIEQLLAFMQEEMGDHFVGHEYEHALRVYKNACEIARGEACDLELVQVSAIVHDYIDYKCFADETTQRQKLSDKLTELAMSHYQIDAVFALIDSISFSKGQVPTTIEGKIVQDADRLDAIGAIGIARTFAYGGSKHRALYGENSSLQHFYDKLFKLKDLMNTPKGRVLAIERHEFMMEFVEQLRQEIPQ